MPGALHLPARCLLNPYMLHDLFVYVSLSPQLYRRRCRSGRSSSSCLSSAAVSQGPPPTPPPPRLLLTLMAQPRWSTVQVRLWRLGARSPQKTWPWGWPGPWDPTGRWMSWRSVASLWSSAPTPRWCVSCCEWWRRDRGRQSFEQELVQHRLCFECDGMRWCMHPPKWSTTNSSCTKLILLIWGWFSESPETPHNLLLFCFRATIQTMLERCDRFLWSQHT